MITLPPGFDYSMLIDDFYTAVLPFVVVASLFVAYRIVMKSIGGRS